MKWYTRGRRAPGSYPSFPPTSLAARRMGAAALVARRLPEPAARPLPSEQRGTPAQRQRLRPARRPARARSAQCRQQHGGRSHGTGDPVARQLLGAGSHRSDSASARGYRRTARRRCTAARRRRRFRLRRGRAGERTLSGRSTPGGAPRAGGRARRARAARGLLGTARPCSEPKRGWSRARVCSFGAEERGPCAGSLTFDVERTVNRTRCAVRTPARMCRWSRRRGSARELGLGRPSVNDVGQREFASEPSRAGWGARPPATSWVMKDLNLQPMD